MWLIGGFLIPLSGCSEDLVRGAADVEDGTIRDRVDTGLLDTVEPADSTADTTSDGMATDVDTGDATGETADADAGKRGGPPYPVVLAHGFAGFEHLADVDQMPYYFDVRTALRTDGEPIYVAEVDPFNDSTRRGKQLVERIEEIVASTPYEHVNIIGHSQGGLDARYAAHHRPTIVKSVVTIATPHQGTMVADIVLEIVEHELLRDIVDALVKLVGMPLYDEVGDKTSLFGALEQMSSPRMEAFNEEITDQPSVFYASITGRTGKRSGRHFCNRDGAPPFLAKWHGERDPVDPVLSLTNDVLEGPGEPPRTNDGLVRVEHAKWGQFLGCIPADHLDEIGQLVGDDPGAGNDFDHIEFYRDLVDYLQRRGF